MVKHLRRKDTDAVCFEGGKFLFRKARLETPSISVPSLTSVYFASPTQYKVLKVCSDWSLLGNDFYRDSLKQEAEIWTSVRLGIFLERKSETSRAWEIIEIRLKWFF